MSRARQLPIASVAERVHAELRTRILTGTIGPGERLNQGALARELGVSLTPVREALRLLSTERLVTLETHRGARARTINAGQQREVWLARLAVEPAAARLAAEVRKPSALAAMREAVDAGGGRGANATADREWRFHLALVDCAGNEYLSAFAETWQPAVPGSCFAAHAGSGSGSAAASDHAAILRAVERGDGRTAEDLMRAHLERCRPAPGDRPG
jgi:DNA-binding GntR family transcriptional regulator